MLDLPLPNVNAEFFFLTLGQASNPNVAQASNPNVAQSCKTKIFEAK
jgi:hypothetical protein